MKSSRNGLLALLRNATIAVDEALVFLGLLQPAESEKPQSELGADSQSVKRVSNVGSVIEVEVLESEAPLLLSEQTGSFLGYGLYIFVQFSREGQGHPVILDSGCSHSVVGRDFLRKHSPNAQVKPFTRPFLNNGVYGGNLTEDYAVIDIYIRARHPVDGRTVVVKLPHQFQVSAQSTASMLIGQDIIKQHGFLIDNDNGLVTIGACNGATAAISSLASAVPQVVGRDYNVEQEKECLREIARNSHRPFMPTSDAEGGGQAIGDASRDHGTARSSRGFSSSGYGAQLLKEWVWRPWKKHGVR